MSNGHDPDPGDADLLDLYFGEQEDPTSLLDLYFGPEPETRLVRHEGADWGEGLEAAKESFHPALGPFAPAFSMIRGMLGSLIGPGEVEKLVPSEGLGEEEVLPREGAIDVTDPSAILEGVDLSPKEKAIGFLRRIGASAAAAATQSPPLAQVGDTRAGLAFPTYAGVELAIQAGQIRPPQDFADHAADFIGVTLPQVGVLGPLGMGTSVGGAVASRVPGVAGRVLGKSLVSGAGQLTAKGLGLEESLKRVAPFMAPTKKGLAGLPRVEEWIGRLVTETALGAGWGAAEMRAVEQLPGMEGVDVDWGAPMAIMTGIGAATGLLRIPTVRALRNAYKDAGRYFRQLPQEGQVVAGRRAVYVQNVRGPADRWNPETKTWERVAEKGPGGISQPGVTEELAWVWHEGPDAGKPAQAPTLAERMGSIQEEGLKRMERVEQVLSSNPEATPSQIHDTLQEMERIPSDLLENHAEEISLRSGRYYLDASSNIGKWNRVRAARGIEANERIMLDATKRSLEERVEAAAEIRTIERVFGENQGAPPGMLPVDEEANAIQAYRQMSKLGHSNESIYTQAVMLMDDPDSGYIPFAKRLAEVADKGGVPARPGTYKEAIADVTRGWNRGLKEGSEVFWKGKRYRIESKPWMGTATARLVDDPNQMLHINLSEATPIPKPGTMVMLKGGTIAEVVGPHSKNKFKAKVAGSAVVSPRQYSHIVAAGEAIPEERLLRAENARLLARLDEADIAPTRVREATTKQGEKVTLVGEGSENVAVRTKRGTTRIIPKDVVSPISKPKMGSGEVTDFVAGTIPDSKNKMLFFTLGEGEVQAFEQALADGTIAETLEATGGGLSAHVFPPARPELGMHLYALEVPSRRSPVRGYQGEARKAVYKALSPGKEEAAKPGVMRGYDTEVPELAAEAFQEGRVYRVPEGLWNAAMLPEELLQQMNRGEQATYLRRLLNLHQDVDSGIMEAAGARLESLRMASEAVSEGKGIEATRATENATRAEIGAIDAANEIVEEEAQGIVDDIFVQAALEDPNFGTWSRLVTEGLNEETSLVFETTLESIPASRTWLTNPKQTVPNEAWLLHHSEQPGLRLQVHKEQRFVTEPRQTPRTPEFVREAAIRVKESQQLYSGPLHADAVNEAVKVGALPQGAAARRPGELWDTGFISSEGRFLSPEEAETLAATAGQAVDKHPELGRLHGMDIDPNQLPGPVIGGEEAVQVPSVEEVFRVVPYDAEGRMIEEGAEYFHTAAGVSKYAIQEGYTRPPTTVSRSGWKHQSKDALGADIYLEGGKVRVNVVENVEVHGSGRRYTRGAEMVSPEEAEVVKKLYAGNKDVTVEYNEGEASLRLTSKQLAHIDNAGLDTGLNFDAAAEEYYIPATKESLELAREAREISSLNETLVVMGEEQLDIPSGTRVHVRRTHLKFDSPEEAVGWLRERKFQSVDPKNWKTQAAYDQGEPRLRYEGTPAERFSRLPAVEELEESLQPSATISTKGDERVISVRSVDVSSAPVDDPNVGQALQTIQDQYPNRDVSEITARHWVVVRDKETGKSLAAADVRVSGDGVGYIEIDGDGPGSAGFRKMREGLEGLRELHPEIKSLAGVRTGGSRNALAAQGDIRFDVEVPLGRASLRVREEAVSNMQLLDTTAGLERIMHEYLAEHNLLPEALYHYARRVYALHSETIGRTTFDRRIRKALNLVDLETDLSPQLKSQHLFDTPYDATMESMSVEQPAFWDNKKKRWVQRRQRSVSERQREEIEKLLVRNEKGELDQPLPKEAVDQLELAHSKLLRNVQRESQAPGGAASAEGYAPEHAQVFPKDDVSGWGEVGVSLNKEAKQTDPLIAAMETVRRQRTLDEMSGVYRDLTPGTVSDPEATIYSAEKMHLARVLETDEIVEIVGANPAEPSVLKVRMGDPEAPVPAAASSERSQLGYRTVDMALNDLELISPETERYMVGKLARERPYESFFRREPGVGFSQTDRKLGIAGTRSIGVTREAYSGRIEELMDSLYKVKGVLDGPQENIDELLNIFTRAQWLGSIDKNRQWRPLFDDLLKRVPQEMRQSIRRGLYTRVKKAGGDTPAAELIAQAHAGVQRLERDPGYMLSKRKEEIIEAWAEQVGMPKHTPLARKATEMVRRQLEDPMARDALEHIVSYKNEQGFLNFGLAMEHVPADNLRIATQSVSDIDRLGFPIAHYFGVPHKVAERHPMSRMTKNMIRLAYEEQAKLGEETDVFVQHMAKLGVQKKADWNDLARYRRDFGSNWEAAAKEGAKPELREGFLAISEELERDLERVIRLQLRGEVHPIKWDPEVMGTDYGKQLKQYLVDQMGIDPATLAESGTIKINAVRARSHGLNLKGLTRGSITEEEINALVTARNMYESAADLPAGRYPNWVYEEFDFWKSYGIQDYWPNIWEGGMKISVNRGDEELLVGWAQNRTEGLRIVKGLMDDGVLAVTPEGVLDEAVSMEVKQNYVDDVILRNFQNHAQIDKMLQKMGRSVAIGPDEMVGVMMQFRRKPGMKKAAPNVVHAMERSADLRHPIEDGLRDISVYKNRIARSEYRLKVSDAWNFLNNPEADRAVSAGWGLQPYYTKGSKGFERLQGYMEEWVNRSLGEPGRIEMFLNRSVAMANMVRYLPKRAKEVWEGKIPLDRLEGIGDAETRTGKLAKHFFDLDQYYAYGAARKTTGQIVSMQSMYRLGLNPASGLANATQFFINTVPMLVDDVTHEGAAVALAARGWWDAADLVTRETLIQGQDLLSPGFWVKGLQTRQTKGIQKLSAQELQGLAEEAGINYMPGKHLAGIDEATWATMSGNLRSGTGLTGRTGDALRFGMMSTFNAPEKVNRLATLFSVYRREMGKMGVKPMTKGAAHDLALARARRMITKTQFLYDEIATPLMFAGGPLGKVVFQFKTYMLNQVGFEKDLVKNAWDAVFLGKGNKSIATRRLAAHFGTLATIGGARGVAAHPVISAILFAAATSQGKFNLDYIMDRVIGGPRDDWGGVVPLGWKDRRLAMTSPEDQLQNDFRTHLQDAFYYGLPGLFGYNLGDRVTVSGQELAMNFDYPGFLGPHLAVYGEAATGIWNWVQTPDAARGKAALGAVTGALITQMLPIPGAGGKTFGSVPLTKLAAGLLGAAVATKGANNSFGTWFTEAVNMSRFKRRGTASVARNVGDMIELYGEALFRDSSGKPTYIPDSDLHFEAISNLMGLPTIRQEEHSALTGYLLAEADAQKRGASWYAEQIARVRLSSPTPGASRKDEYALIAKAAEAGITVSDVSISAWENKLLEDSRRQLWQQTPEDVKKRYREQSRRRRNDERQ